MPSRALRNWQTRSRKVLDEVEAAHAVEGRRLMRIRPYLMFVDDPEPFEVPLTDLTLAE